MKKIKEELARLCATPTGKVRAGAINALVSVLAGAICAETRGQENWARWSRFNNIETEVRAHFESCLDQEEPT